MERVKEGGGGVHRVGKLHIMTSWLDARWRAVIHIGVHTANLKAARSHVVVLVSGCKRVGLELS